MVTARRSGVAWSFRPEERSEVWAPADRAAEQAPEAEIDFPPSEPDRNGPAGEGRDPQTRQPGPAGVGRLTALKVEHRRCEPAVPAAGSREHIP